MLTDALVPRQRESYELRNQAHAERDREDGHTPAPRTYRDAAARRGPALGGLERDGQGDHGHPHDRREVAGPDQARRRTIRDLLLDDQPRRHHRRLLGRDDRVGNGDASRRQGELHPLAPHKWGSQLLRREARAHHPDEAARRRLGRAAGPFALLGFGIRVLGAPMKIDVFPHILPKKYFDRLVAVAPPGLALQKRMSGIPVLVDVELRLTMMDRWDGYVQVLTLANPPIEGVDPPAASPDLARLANDEMAAILARHPDRFPGFVASLPMNNPDAALGELERALDHLGATGVQIFSNVNGRPLDLPEYQSIFARMAERRLPIWLHPARPATVADYAGEPRSKYDLWWAFGWPYETSVAMGRLVFSGLFDRHPELVIITHHLGAMIPFCEGRIGGGLDQLGARSDDPDDAGTLGRLERRPIDYFRMFYGDTALFGAWHAMESGLAFFGADHVLFGTDFPFDPERGPGFIRDTIAAMERMRASDLDKAKIYAGNARRLLRLKPA